MFTKTLTIALAASLSYCAPAQAEVTEAEMRASYEKVFREVSGADDRNSEIRWSFMQQRVGSALFFASQYCAAVEAGTREDFRDCAEWFVTREADFGGDSAAEAYMSLQHVRQIHDMSGDVDEYADHMKYIGGRTQELYSR